MELEPVVPGRIWSATRPVPCGRKRLPTRMSVIRLPDGRLWLHAPVHVDRALEDEIRTLGEVAFIVASSTAHDAYLSAAMRLWPRARTFACPGLPGKRPDLQFDAPLQEHAEPEWAPAIDQVRFGGNQVMREVVFFHRGSRTLIVTDLLMNLQGRMPGVSRYVRGAYRLFGLWGVPVPAPEYLLYTWDRRSSRNALLRVLEWDFQRVLMAHGEVLEGEGVKEQVARVWAPLMRRW